MMKRQRGSRLQGWLSFAQRAVLTVIVVCISVSAQAQRETPTRSARSVVEHFCSLDAKGARLTLEGQTHISEISQFPDTWTPGGGVVVLQKYSVSTGKTGKNTNYFIVNYDVWGTLDTSLRFARLEGTAVGRSVTVKESIDLKPTSTHYELHDGRMTSIEGRTRWRIRALPSSPHVDLEAAIEYVSERREKSTDPVLQANAKGTLSLLSQLRQANTSALSLSYRTSPKSVVKEFCTLDFKGGQLFAAKSRALSGLFSASNPKQGTISIVKYFTVSDASITGDKATVMAEYEYLGTLDRSAKLELSPARGMKLRADFSLTLISVPDIGAKDAPRMAWKIDGPIPNPQVSVNSAIQYLAELRAKSNDPSLRKNADRALLLLRGSAGGQRLLHKP